MCGIAGLFRRGGGDESRLTAIVTDMTEALAYRGPDAAGYWTHASAGIAFGHRRLSVLDLSPAGSQPMHSDCGRFTVTFNGEIYNHLDIRRELEATGAAPNWRGHSDTETLLCAVRHWGLEAALQRFSGMFALALWDERERTLTLARDRFGEKPLFYGWSGNDLVFASELKALAKHPAWSPSLDRAALTSFMRYAYVPAPSTIWTGIKKLPSASCVTFETRWPQAACRAPKPYWSMRDTVVGRAGKSRHGRTGGGRRIAAAAVDRDQAPMPVRCAVRGIFVRRNQFIHHCRTDAGASQPTGSHLHHRLPGRRRSMRRPKRARLPPISAPHIPSSMSIRKRHGMSFRNCRRCMTSRSANSSQIPTHLVSALARQHVTVALSGDAGDEMFGGYNRHVWGDSLNARFGAMPAALRQMLGALLRAVSPEPAGTIARLASPLLPARFNVRRAGDQVAKLARIVGSPSLDDMYRELCSIDNDPTQTIVQGEEGESWSDRGDGQGEGRARSARSDDACGFAELSDRRHPAKGRSSRDGGCAGNPRAVSRQGCRGICRQNSARHESSRRPRQMAGPAGALSARSGQIWSTGRRRASAFRSTTGCAGR